jgi:hypothetical protein
VLGAHRALSNADWVNVGARIVGGSRRIDVARARFEVRKLPRQWRERLITKFVRDWLPIQGQSDTEAYSRASNAWVGMLRSVLAVERCDVINVQPFGNWRRITAATSDDAIVDTARRAARWCTEQCEFARVSAGQRIRTFMAGWGLGEKDGVPCETVPMVARGCDARWWRRKLRVIRNRCTERAALALGCFAAGGDRYCSEVNRAGFAARDAKTLRMMRETRLVGESSECTLYDAWRASVSNPQNRLHEVVTRIRGHEDCGKQRGDVCLFVTLTCPSRFHAVKHGGERNPAWQGGTPRDAQMHLRKVWASARRRLNERGLFIHGMRIAEPHHDGCAHWHLAIWCSPESKGDVKEILRLEALRDSPNEPGAKLHRIKFEEIDQAKGDVIGYMLKYLLKNLPVERRVIENDSQTLVLTEIAKKEINHPQKSVELTERISETRPSVWARVWGVRQFQFFGSAPVTLWRFIRRMAISEFEGEVRDVVERFHRVGDRMASFADFMRESIACEGMFGMPSVGFKAVAAHTDKTNGYGEPIAARTIGVETSIGKVYHVFRERFQVIRRGVGYLGRVPITVRAGGGAWGTASSPDS